MNTSPFFSSDEIVAQVFAAPVWWAFGPIHVFHAGSDSCLGMGSHDQMSFPLSTSKALTVPAVASKRLLSPRDDPTTTRFPIIAGAEVTLMSLPRPVFKFTVPWLPNAGTGNPDFAERAISLPSMVAIKTFISFPASVGEGFQILTPRDVISL